MSAESQLDLQAEERDAQRPELRRRAAVAQRVGWALLALILVMALAGLLGPGPLSRSAHSSADGRVTLEYDRFVRNTGSTMMQITARADPGDRGQARVWLSPDYLSSMQIQQVVPDPDSWTSTTGGVVLAFPVDEAGSQVNVQVQMYPQRVGLVRGAVGDPAGEPIEFWQFVYP